MAVVHHAGLQAPANLITWLRARGITLSRLQALHPSLDRAVHRTRRELYERRFFREGPRRQGQGGKTFVIFNHCYDLDVDALLAADTPHTLWVLDPFQLFTDLVYFFPPEHRDLNCVYGEGAMAATIERYKRQFARRFTQRLVRETGLHALITPSDTFYYLRPIIEELRALGVPTVVQDKEGTIAPSALMDEHARVLAERYPPIADAYYFWNANVRDYWRKIGAPEDKMRVLGQPRSDFFFHEERWPTKSRMGLTEGKRLVVFFTYEADAYLRTTEVLADRPWKPLRDATHQALRQLARERDDLEVVIKAHPQQLDLADVETEFAADPLPNVRVTAGAGTASHLIVRADVIVGFQSTVMIEAMLTRKPVIYAGWGPVHDANSKGLVPIHTSGGCLLPKNGDELARQLRDALDGKLAPSPEMQRARRAFTDRYFYGADGHVAERVLAAAAGVV